MKINFQIENAKSANNSCLKYNNSICYNIVILTIWDKSYMINKENLPVKEQVMVKKFIQQNREKFIRIWETQVFEELFLND